MSNRYFPFHALGFRCNPFRTLTDDEWAYIAVLPESIQALLQNGFAHLQILGEPGYGKTTILLALAAKFRAQGKRVEYEYLPEDQSQFKTDCVGLDVFVLDEVQRLVSSERERLIGIAHHTQLIIASHEDLTPLFASHSLGLASVQIENSDSGVLRTILSRRLDYFRQVALKSDMRDSSLRKERSAQNDSQIDFSPDAIVYLSNMFRGNLRAMEQFLYEVFQRLDRAEIIDVERLK